MAGEKQYIELYTENKGLIDRNSCPLMNSLRNKAFGDFCRLGFPTQKVERYKYTDVANAFAPNYGVNLNRMEFPVNPYEAFHCNVPNLSTSLFFIINDSFYKKNQGFPSLPDGVEVGSLRELAEKDPEKFKKYYGRLADTSSDAITALNTMLAQDGLLVFIPKGTKLTQTLQIVNILQAEVDLLANRRILIILEEGAKANILLCDHTGNTNKYLSTQVIEIYAGKGSELEFYELEETQTGSQRFSNLYLEEAEGANVTMGSITLQGGLSRNKSDLHLCGRGAKLRNYGAVIADKAQHTDNNILVIHEAEECQSDILYKYVLDGQAIGAFTGHVLVRPGAQKTESQETNANLCVSDAARMYTQPMLEIYADDVKCNHGSSVGNLDKQALFYMQQRGLPKEEAYLLLQHAFLYDVVRRISLEPLRERLSHLIEKRFRGELSLCKTCTKCNK